MTAADARSHLVQLEAERAVAHVEGLDDEIASLREHGGPRTRRTLHDGRLGGYDWPSQASTLSRLSATQS